MQFGPPAGSAATWTKGQLGRRTAAVQQQHSTRTAMRQMMGVFAQLDRGMTVAKIRRSRRIKGEKGQYAYGAPSYDWQAHRNELTEEEMEQAGRVRARQLRDQDELSYREIAAVLAAEGIRPKRGERWQPETVRRMLANTTDRPPTLRKRSIRP
ncbi:recombinase family protein [Streptomyces sp. NPDC000994]